MQVFPSAETVAVLHFADGDPGLLLERVVLLGVLLAVRTALRAEPELHLAGEQCRPYVGQQAVRHVSVFPYKNIPGISLH